MQGLNVVVDIYAKVQGADDAVGGSVRTDALRYANVKARISNQRPASLLMQQGFQVRDMHEIIIYPDAYPAIEEEDLVIPQTGRLAGARLRVVSVQPSSLTVGHPRAHVQLFCERMRYANDNVPDEAAIT